MSLIVKDFFYYNYRLVNIFEFMYSLLAFKIKCWTHCVAR